MREVTEDQKEKGGGLDTLYEYEGGGVWESVLKGP